MFVLSPGRCPAFAFRLAAVTVSIALLAGGTPATAQPAAPMPSPAANEKVLGAARPPAGRPNIVMIMADDMRVDDLRYMPRTRQLLGRRGATFANSFSPYPLCCPARASFLTGQYTHNHRVWSQGERWGFRAFKDDSTLPVWLQKAGYQTGFIGKYLNGYGAQELTDGTPSATYVPPGWDDWRGALDGNGGLDPDDPLAGGTYRYFDTTLNVNGTITAHPGEYQTDMLGDQSIEMLDDFASEDAPFFLYSSFVAPHHGKPVESDDPRRVRRDDGGFTQIKTPARPRWVKGMFDDVIQRPPGLVGDPNASLAGKPRFMRSLVPINAAERRAMLNASRQRAESVYVLDRQVQRIVGTLRRTGELSNTIIAFTSDNGYFAGEFRIRQGKILPYEPALRVPLLLRGPGISRGVVRTAPISTVDLAPTFAQAAKVTPGSVVDGRAMGDVFTRDRVWNRGILTTMGPRDLLASDENAGAFGRVAVQTKGQTKGRGHRSSVGLRTSGWLYVEHASGEKEMYDMRADPRQLRNVIRFSEYAGLRRLLAAKLQRLKNCEGSVCTSLLPVPLRAPGRRPTSSSPLGHWGPLRP